MDMQRVSKLESKVEGLEEDIQKIEAMLSRHGHELDALASRLQELNADLLLIKKDVESIDGTVKRVENTLYKLADKLDDLKDQRVQDHLETPLANHRRILWQVIGIVVGLLATFILGLMFPMTLR